jgi:hypothetical protein
VQRTKEKRKEKGTKKTKTRMKIEKKRKKTTETLAGGEGAEARPSASPPHARKP